jgi:hypothetical protein
LKDSTNTETNTERDENYERRSVDADLIEATPDRAGLGFWILASPLLGFLGWLWVDLVRALAPTAWSWANITLGLLSFAILIVLPLGYVAFLAVTSLPRLFRHAGWDLQPREPVRRAEMYTVRYVYCDRHRARTTRNRVLMRAAQGWFFIEIATIFAGALLLPALFFSAAEFGFGQ